jgi:acyl carrier protein
MTENSADSKTASKQALSKIVLEILGQIAPEIEPAKIAMEQPLRRQVDLDSIDWLNFLLGLEQRCGVAIPQADYAVLRSLNDVLDYLLSRRAM